MPFKHCCIDISPCKLENSHSGRDLILARYTLPCFPFLDRCIFLPSVHLTLDPRFRNS